MEQEFKKRGFNLIAGVDEAGRGPLAGPVVAAAVILPADFKLSGVKDSKKLTPLKRKKLNEQIKKCALAWRVEVVDVSFIDKHNILRAALLAMQNCVLNLAIKPDCVLVDGNQTIPQIKAPQFAIVKGDQKCKSISCASILAKVYRDEIMLTLHEKYPQYDFAQNKGYGSKSHLNALKRHGATDIHRKSYAPVKLALSNNFEQLIID